MQRQSFASLHPLINCFLLDVLNSDVRAKMMCSTSQLSLVLCSYFSSYRFKQLSMASLSETYQPEI